MNYIFLDIDGVLNSEEFLLQNRDKLGQIDPSKVKLLADLVKATEAKIILSSSWRIFFNDDLTIKHKLANQGNLLLQALTKEGLTLSGKTKYLVLDDYKELYWERPNEIALYIHENLKSSDNFIILDDEDCGLSEKFNKHFIKTNFYKNGLTKKHVNLGIKILNKKNES